MTARRETPFLTPHECAALAWTQAIAATAAAIRAAPDDVHAALCDGFGGNERMNLSLAIPMINGWDRPAFSLRRLPDAGDV